MSTPITEQTPAQKTAAILAAVAAHLTAHPHLPAVNVSRDGDVHIASYGSDWTDETGLIAWAETLPDATITADVINRITLAALSDRFAWIVAKAGQIR